MVSETILSEDKRFCDCGCGELIPSINKLGKPARFKYGHQFQLYSGSNHYNWKGGRKIDKQGYIFVKAKWHPRARASSRYMMREHILVMEKKLGRYLRSEERVHHINGNKQDNRPENLQLMTNTGEHTKLHFEQGDIVPPSRKDLSTRSIRESIVRINWLFGTNLATVPIKVI